MIVGGKSRADAGSLGIYLGTKGKNEEAEILRVEGFAGTTAHDALRELDAMASGSRTKNPAYHAWLAPPPGQTWTAEQLNRAVETFLEGMGWQGQPYVLARHRDDKGDHYHLGVSRLRVDEKTGKIRTVSVSQSYRKHTAIAEKLGSEFGYAKIKRAFQRNGEDFKDRGFTDRETFEARQRGQAVEDLKAMKADVKLLWSLAETPKAFYDAALASGITIAKSAKGAIMAVDAKGGAYALTRLLSRRAAEIKARLETIASLLPTVDEVKDALRAKSEGTRRDRPEGQADQPARGQTARPEQPAEQIGPATARDVLDGLTRNQSTFTRYQLEKAVEKAQATGEDGRRLMAEIGRSWELVALGRDRMGRERFTTTDMQAVERRMVETAGTLASNGRHNVRRKIVENVPGRTMLNEGQEAALRHITAKGDLKLVQGYAGTGKSTMLGAAREAWEAQGFRVRGMALAGIAVDGLRSGSGIESRTIASTLWRIENGKDTLTSRDILVVDEAGMIDSRQMAKILNLAMAAGAKVILVGDGQQLQAIGAGAAFRALQERFGCVILDEIIRQREAWQKEATLHFATERSGSALDAYNLHGGVHEAASRDDAKTALLSAWDKVNTERPETRQIILTYTNVDVADLNREARQIMRERGALGDDIELRGRNGVEAYAAGDRLYFLKNDALMGVSNGTLGTIQEIDGARVTVKLDEGRTLSFNANLYQDFAHGYVSTIHKSQGATVDQTHVYASQYMDRQAAYVAMSRHRDGADLYYGKDEFSSFDQLKAALGRDRAKDTTLDYELEAMRADKEQPRTRAKEKGKATGGTSSSAEKSFQQPQNTGRPMDKSQEKASPQDRLDARLGRGSDPRTAEERTRDILRQLEQNRTRGPRGPSM